MATFTYRNKDIDFKAMDEAIVGEDELLFRNADRYFYEPDLKNLKRDKKFSIKSQVFFLIVGLLMTIGLIVLLIIERTDPTLIDKVLNFQVPFMIALIGSGLFTLIVIFKILYCALEKQKKPAKSPFNIYNSTLDLENKNGQKAIVITKTYSYIYYLMKILGFLSAALVAGAMVFVFVLLLINSDDFNIGVMFGDIFGGAALLTVMVLGAQKDWYFHYYDAFILSFNGLSYLYSGKSFTRIE